MSSQLELRLPDGSIRKVAPGTTVHQVAADIGAGLAKAAVAGEIEGQVVETARPLHASGAFASSPPATRTPCTCFGTVPRTCLPWP